LNDASPVGDLARLDVRIARKSWLAASGERLDVIRDMAFVLPHGEVGAIVGPSGCGKTTMLRIVAGLDADYEGEIIRPPGRLGMVFQEPRLLPWRSVEQNVRLVAPEIGDAALSTLFEILGLAGHRQHFPGELSLGLARRVALARAFAVEPHLLILDEPFASLDAALAARLHDELAILVARRPVTTVLVTHDVDEAIRLADRLFLLAPRPTRVIAEIGVTRPRQTRSAEEVTALKRTIAERLHAHA
jgi:ABC-type nitrate/sulfonate/bicarbonate transport system ATPase subunit